MDPTVDQEQLHTRVSQELQTYLNKGVADYFPAGRMLTFALIGALLGLGGSLVVRRANVEANRQPKATWVRHSLNAVHAAWQTPTLAHNLAPLGAAPVQPATTAPQGMPEPRAAQLASLKLDGAQPLPVVVAAKAQPVPRSVTAKRPSKETSRGTPAARPAATQGSQGLLIPPVAHSLAQPVAPPQRAEHGLLIPPNFASTLP